jgi:hypothetical protein
MDPTLPGMVETLPRHPQTIEQQDEMEAGISLAGCCSRDEFITSKGLFREVALVFTVIEIARAPPKRR